MTEGLSNKEMLIRIMNQNDKALVTQTELLSHAKNVDAHLNELNSKVATNVKRIYKVEKEQSRVTTIFGTLSVLLSGAWAVVTFLVK